MAISYLLLGSNIGLRSHQIKEALFHLSAQAGEIRKLSSLYETAAWGKVKQADYLNQVVQIETSLDPQELLKQTSSIESEMGRIRAQFWGPRIIDIDILFYNDIILSEENLKIPHPLIQNRRFVLTPLVEVAPRFIHPALKKTVTQLLKECEDPLWVRKFQETAALIKS